jgi:hypothetical protein
MRLALITIMVSALAAAMAPARALAPALLQPICRIDRRPGSRNNEDRPARSGGTRSPAIAHAAALGRAEPAGRMRAREQDYAIGRVRGRTLTIVLMAAICALGAGVRLWQLDAVGFNSDEAVYAGQAASIAHHPDFRELFPVFRAHPLLFQTILSIGFQIGWTEVFARVVSAVVGVLTVVLVF